MTINVNSSLICALFTVLVISSWLVTTTSAASCTTTVGGKYYNLNALTKIGSNSDWKAKAPNGDLFWINFCSKVTTPGICPAIPSAVCGNFSTGQGSAGASTSQSWAALQTGTGVSLTYADGSLCPGTTTKRMTTINVVCDPNQKPGVFGAVAENANCKYVVEFQSAYGCPTTAPPPPPPPPGPPGPPGPPPPPPPPPDCSGSGSGSGSGCGGGGNNGIYFIIAVVVVSVVYFGGGSLVRKFAMHKEGSDIIPQVDFWKDLPFLVKDGIVYSVTKIFHKIRGGESEPLLH